MTVVTTSQTQLRAHAGHSHGHHHHHHDNTYLTSTNKDDAGVRITRIGLYVNLAMAISKGWGGYYFHSQALSADAIHSLTDLVSDFMTLATVSWALKPPTDRFPFGYGKVESLGSLGVSSLLLAGGVIMGWSAVLDLMHIYAPGVFELVEQLPMFGHSHGHSHHIPNIQAAWLAGGSVLVKEWLYRATMKVARERKSSVLESNAVHHRVDSLTGIAALISIAASNVFPTLIGMDALGGLLISWLVIRTGWSNTKASLVELADAGIDDDMKSKVSRAALQGFEVMSPNTQQVSVRRVQGVKAGQNYLLELELEVPASWSIEKSHAIEEAVRKRVGEKIRGARRVRVRFVPDDSADDFLQEFISPSVSARSSPEPQEEYEVKREHENNQLPKSPGVPNEGNGVIKRR